MPAALQAKILRVLDHAALRPLGSSKESRVDVRFLFSTNRNLQLLVEEGRVRRGLFFRLGGLEVAVPPLRERLEDLPALVEHFRAQAGDPSQLPRFDDKALRALAAHPWPGNVRELQNAVNRLVLTCAGTIPEAEVRRVLGEKPAQGLFSTAQLRSRPLDQLLADLEREYLLQLHADSGGDLKAMAAGLGITRRALYARFQRLGIRPRGTGHGNPAESSV